MGAISGQVTTYAGPNYTGELYRVSPSDTPFLSLIGGLHPGGGATVNEPEVEWQTSDYRSGTANNVALEGAAAPTAVARSRSNVSNVLEIHQSQIAVSYTKQAAYKYHAGVNNEAPNPVTDEVAEQIQNEIVGMSIDLEKSFLSGTYQKPANNSTARQTRGILSAITTNVNANGGTGRALTKAIIDNTLKTAFDNGARLPQDKTVFMCGSAQKINLSNLYATATLSQPTLSRNIAGMAFDTIVTDFGTFGVVLNRWFPTGQIGVLDLSVCEPVFLELEDGSSFSVEPLAKTGASYPWQLYFEAGLKYGSETFHALIKDLN